MKRFYQILFLLAFGPMLAVAQEQTKQTFTLEQCIEYALQNSVNAKNAILDQEIAEQVILDRKSEGLPQISGNVSIQDNTKLPRFFTRYDPNPDAPSFGGDLSQVPGIKAGDVVAAQNFFQLPSNGNASLAITQMIFNSSYFLGLKAMKTYRQLSVRTTQQTKEEIIANVTKAYYAVIITNDRLVLHDNNINRVDSLLKNTKAMNENGFSEGIDVDRTTVTLNNLKTERDKFDNIRTLSIELLKLQMNYPSDQSLEVAGSIGSLRADVDVVAQYSSNWNYDQRIDYQILETSYKLQELDIKAKRARSLPTLSAFYNLGYQTQSPDVAGLFKTNSGIKDYGAIGPDKWYQYSNYGVTVNIPIFSGLHQYSTVQQAKLTLVKMENSIAMIKSSIDLETKQSAITYINATKSLRIQEENRGLAEKVARITKIKYEQGVGSNTEVIQAESSLKEAQVNYYNSLYDALVSKVDLDKAYGKLTPQATTENK